MGNAIVKIKENILDADVRQITVSEGQKIEEIIRSNTVGDRYNSSLVECFDCDTGRTFYAPISDDNENLSVSVIVNGKDKPLDYAVCDGDVVNVIFLPTDSDVWDWLGAGLGALTGVLIGSSIGTMIAPGIGTIIGALAGGVIGFFVGGFVTPYIKEALSPKKGTSTRGEESESLPDIRGSQNQPLIGNVFPAVMGKHLVTPFIIGSTYNEIYGNHGTEIYIHALYLVGYAPLRITDLKLGDQFLAHNQSWAGNKSMNNVFHGKLEGTLSTDDSDLGDIVNTWMSNDIAVEILQQGQNGEEIDWGTIYPYARIQDDINANVLHIVDGDGDLISYKGLSLANGLRNNPVKFTCQCPKSARIELDFPSGLYKTRSEKSGDDSNVHYYTIPLWAAIQWRVYSSENDVSDGEKPGVISGELDPLSENYWRNTEKRGWHSFTIANGFIRKVDIASSLSGTYTRNDEGDNRFKYTISPTINFAVSIPSPIAYDINVNATVEINMRLVYVYTLYVPGFDGGLYPASFEGHTDKTEKIDFSFKLNAGDTTASFSDSVGVSDSYLAIYKPSYVKSITFDTKFTKISISGSTLTKNFKFTTVNVPLSGSGSIKNQQISKSFDIGVEAEAYTRSMRDDDIANHSGNTITASINEKWLDASAFNFAPLGGTDSAQTGINEFRVVSEVDFVEWARKNLLTAAEKSLTGEAYDAMLAKRFKEYFLSSSNTMKSVEVRIVRLSPNYLDEKRSTSDHSAFSFNDIFSWNTLTSTMLDENKLNEGEIVQKRPLSEADMRKHCVIAIKAKTDNTDQIGNTLRKFTCIAESFAPYYDDGLKQWFPRTVESITKYYRPYDISTGKRGEEITREQFIADRQSGIKSVQRKAGNDFVKNLVTNVIRVESNKDSLGRYIIPLGYTRNETTGEITWNDSYITDATGKKLWNKNAARYCENNVASVILWEGLGAHMGINALSYSDYDLMALASVFEFCKEVRDGSQYTADGYHYDHYGNPVWHYRGDEVVIYFTANGYIYEMKKFEDVLASLSAAARTVYTRNRGNKLTFIIDKPERYHVALINQANTLSSSYSINFSELPSAVMLQFKDEHDGYEENSVYAWADGESKDDYTGVVESYSFNYVTNPYQLWSLGRYLLANRIMNREIVTKKIGMEGASIGLGNIVLLQDDTMLIGNDFGGRITRLIEDEGYIYGFIINNTYHMTDETELVITHGNNTLHAPEDFPYTSVKNGDDAIRFEIPKGTTLSESVTASVQVTYADETTDIRQIEFTPVSCIEDNPDFSICLYLECDKKILKANDSNGIVLRASFSPEATLLFVENALRLRHMPVFKWYKDGNLIEGESGNMYRATVPGVYEVRTVLSLGKVTYSMADYVTIVSSDGYKVTSDKERVFVPVDSDRKSVNSVNETVSFKLYKNSENIKFGDESKAMSAGLGVTIMQPSQNKESRVITLPIAPIGTVCEITIDGKPFAVKKGDTNVVILATKISKNGIKTDGSVAYVYNPQVDNIVGFGYIGKESALYRVIRIKHDSKHNYEFTLIKYQPELYEYGRKLPSFQNNITMRNDNGDSYNLSNSATPSDLANAIQQASEITVAKGLNIVAENGTVFKNGHPETLTLRAVTNGFTAVSWQWSKDGADIEGATAETVAVREAGVYRCTARSETATFFAYITITSVSDGVSRILNSLEETGTDGEMAIYLGAFFLYSASEHAWIRLDDSSYHGVLDSPPENAALDSFYLHSAVPIEEKFEVSDGTSLILSDGTELVVNSGGSEGFIFYLDESGWHRDDNRNSWRYIVAFNDLLANGWDLPANFDAYLANMMEQKVADKTPKYLGSVFKVPVTANEGDWFTWAGESTGSFEKGRVYMAEVTRGSISWKKLDENETANHSYFMAALSDILLLKNAEHGYFSTVFANALITHEVFTNRLEVVGNTAESNAKTYADGKASTAESNAVATSTEQRNEMAKKLGYASYDDMVAEATAGKTIIEGGHIRTLLIEVVDLLAQNITLKQNGYIQSSNYAENNGVPTAGFKIDAANNNIKAVDGVFGGTINATNGVLNNVTVNGFIKSDRVYTRTIAAAFFVDNDNENRASINNVYTISPMIMNTENVAFIKKVATGKYVIYLKKDLTDIGNFKTNELFAYAKVIFASDSVRIDDYSSLGYEMRYSRNMYMSSCRLVPVIKDAETGVYVPVDNSYLVKSLTGYGYPHPIIIPSLYEMEFFPFTEYTEGPMTYMVVGLISTDNNNDQYVSLVGGCHLMIDVVHYDG